MVNKKILVLTNHSYMLWRFRQELIAELARENEVVLCMPFVGHEDDFQSMGLRCLEVHMARRGKNPFQELALLRTYWRTISREKPDLVLTYSIKPNIYGGLVCRMRKIPYCANVQGLGTAFQYPAISHVVTKLYRMAMKRVGRVFFENEENAALFCSRKIVKKEKISVLHGAGINLGGYPVQPYPEEEPFRFLYLGRIMREKGVNELFAAAQRLHAEGEQFTLELVGFFEDAYKAQVEALEQAGIVRFHGFQADPRPFYAMAHCVVLPSYHEGMSNVLLEGAATGRPLITSDIPGCREAVAPGKSGLLCPARDAEALYRAMKEMLAFSRQTREQMGLAGREKIEREFRKETVVAQAVQGIDACLRQEKQGDCV